MDNDIAAEALAPQLFNTLVHLSEDDHKLKPMLATSWQMNEARTEYIFTLRDNVTFQTTDWFTPTRTMNADDVVFTFDRILDSSHPFHYVGGADYPWFSAIGFSQTVKDVVALDDRHVKFVLSAPDNTFLPNLSTIYSAIQSKEYGDLLIKSDLKQYIDTHPVGTGPFYLDEYSVNDFVRLRSNHDYWNGKPKMEQVVFDISSRGTGTLAKLLRNKCDVLYAPKSSQIPTIQQNPNLVLQAHPSMNVSFIALQTQSPALNDVRVRKALNLAVNRSAIIDSVYYGYGTPAFSILPPESWAYQKDSSQVRYDRNYARALLREAGYGKGLELSIWVQAEPTVYNPSPRKVAELLQSNFADIGIKLDILLDERLTRTQIRERASADMILSGWSADTTDPDNFFRPLLSCNAEFAGLNISTWCNPDFDFLLNLAKETTEQRYRLNLYRQAQNMLNEEVPVVPIAHGMQFQAKHKSLKGFNASPFNTLSFENVEREK
ncbi:peptide transport periplasmic protein sapA [Vibrio sp. JCM 19236]|nr:peptide transport periplasmic protein sapA [Vibrio sp. JCM 19236]